MNNLTHLTKRIRRAGLAGLALPLEHHDHIGDAFIEATATRIAAQAEQIRQLYREHGFAVVLHLLMSPALSLYEVYDLRFVGDYVNRFPSWDAFAREATPFGRRRVTRRSLRRRFRVIEIFGTVYVFRRPGRAIPKGW